MKNQYVGDIGDYGKYGLLRFLAKHGIKIGVNWYLTENDNRTDGEIRKYLMDDKENGEKCYDEDLFKKLKPIAEKKKKERSIIDVETNGIIPNAVFFHEYLKAPKEDRTRWHTSALDTLLDAGLIFADPDNGILVAPKKFYRPNGIKYALINELREYYDRGQDVVYYCHKGRRKDDDWNARLEDFNNDGKHHAKIFVLTFHRGTQRSFVFAIHPEREKIYKDLLVDFIKNTEWGTHKAGDKKIPFTLDKSPADSD